MDDLLEADFWPGTTSVLPVTHSELVNSQLFDQMVELYPHWVANQSWLIVRIPAAITYINR